jgi:hypothetical protein
MAKWLALRIKAWLKEPGSGTAAGSVIIAAGEAEALATGGWEAELRRRSRRSE